MASNKLMEAAADILAGSKKSAPGMPTQKLQGSEYAELGGPSNKPSQGEDRVGEDPYKDYKIDPENAKRAVPPKTKPSSASADTQLKLGGGKKTMTEEEFEELHELSTKTLARAAHSASDPDSDYYYGKSHDPQKFADHAKKTKDAKSAAAVQGAANAKGHYPRDKKMREEEEMEEAAYQQTAPYPSFKKKKPAAPAEDMKKKMKEDVDALFADDSTISEEFKYKVSTIFEARVEDRVSQIEEEIETHYAGMLEEAVESIRDDLTEKVDDYLSYVVEQWMADNEIAIESGLRSELTEDFIAGMRNLFAEHYIDVPAEKVDLVDELASKVEELESKLNEEIERAVDLKKSLVESHKVEMTREVCEGLTDTQVEKIKSLAESVQFSTEDEYKNKLETIRENYFPFNAKKATQAHLHEEFEEESAKLLINDPFVAAVSQAISKTKM